MPINYTTNLGALSRLRDDRAMAARRKLFEVFVRECAPGPEHKAADFGVSGNSDHPVHYFVESFYPYTRNLTAVGRETEHARWMPERFPGLSFIEADLRSIPVEDGFFDIGICNAVVEHAGVREQQRRLVHEVCRVCKRVMFTTPNRAFPLELHTFVPVLHWLPGGSHRRLLKALGFSYFADIENLNLLTRSQFLDLFPSNRRNRLVHAGGSTLGANLVCVSSID